MGKRTREDDKEFLKSLYKYMLKKYGKTASGASRHKDEAKTIVEDVVDPNFEAEVAPSKIPVKKPGVLRKDQKQVKPPKPKKNMNLPAQRPRVKGVKRLKSYMKKK